MCRTHCVPASNLWPPIKDFWQQHWHIRREQWGDCTGQLNNNRYRRHKKSYKDHKKTNKYKIHQKAYKNRARTRSDHWPAINWRVEKNKEGRIVVQSIQKSSCFLWDATLEMVKVSWEAQMYKVINVNNDIKNPHSTMLLHQNEIRQKQLDYSHGR